MKLKNVIRKTAALGLALAFTVTGSGCGTESAKGEATTVEAAETARILQAVKMDQFRLRPRLLRATQGILLELRRVAVPARAPVDRDDVLHDTPPVQF